MADLCQQRDMKWREKRERERWRERKKEREKEKGNLATKHVCSSSSPLFNLYENDVQRAPLFAHSCCLYIALQPLLEGSEKEVLEKESLFAKLSGESKSR